jgi:hypothetical protein
LRVDRTLLCCAVAVLAGVLASPALAGHRVPHRPFAKLTVAQRARWLGRQISHDRGAIRWYSRHLAEPFPERFLLTTGRLPLPALLLHAHQAAELAWFRSSLRVASAHRAVLERQLETPGFGGVWPSPPQNLLADFRCIGKGESGNGAASSNLYGMLDGWAAAGGGAGLASRDHRPNAWEASPAEQLYRAWLLEQKDGWSPWTTAPGCGL